MLTPSEFRRHPVAARWSSNIGLFVLLVGIAALYVAGADRLVVMLLFAAGSSLLAIGRMADAERFGGMFTMRPSDLFLLLLYFGMASGCLVEIAYLIRGEDFCSSRGLCSNSANSEAVP